MEIIPYPAAHVLYSPPAAHDVFLSHSGHQKGFAKDLYHRLSSLSYTVFFDQDPHSLSPGQPFPKRIFDAAKTCKIAIVVLSPEFLTTPWPMMELCAFVDRLSMSSSREQQFPAPSHFILLPLFLKLSPCDLTRKENVDEWRKIWEGLEKQGVRISPAKCEEAVTKHLRRINGIVRGSESTQGEASYIEEVINRILHILPARKICGLRYAADPNKEYVGRQRLCKIIIDQFKELEDTSNASLLHVNNNNMVNIDACCSLLGMYGIPGSGKSTLCDLLCDSMFDEFVGQVICLELPNEMKGDASVRQQYVKLLSRFSPHKDIASMDLNQLYNLLLNTTFSYKMFLVLDNITSSNYESYSTMVKAILSSAMLALGSRVVLVARSRAILENLLMEAKLAPATMDYDSKVVLVARSHANRGKELARDKKYSRYTYAIRNVPSLTEAEAMQIIWNLCPWAKEGLITHLLCKSSFQSSTVMFIPFVFEQIGVLLREKRYSDLEELDSDLKILWEMVDEGKKCAVQKLVEINFEQLPQDLRLLFFDIALYIIPAGYERLDAATPILSSMHGITDTMLEKIKIQDLQKHCCLSIVEDKLQVHDIFLEYAGSYPGNSTSYIHKGSLDISGGSSSSSVQKLIIGPMRKRYDRNHPETPQHIRLEYLEARTIDIDADLGNMCLYVEIGAKARVFKMRNRSMYSQCILGLSGDLSSLVCLEMENVKQVAISPSTNDAQNLSNLVRLELSILNMEECLRKTCSGQKRKYSARLWDFISNNFYSYAQSMKWPWKTVFPWGACALASYSELVSNMAISGQLRNLRVLSLENAGIPRLEDVGRWCPQLEVLEVLDKAHVLTSIRVGDAPNLKRLVIKADIEFADEYYHGATKSSHRKSRQLVLKLNQCPQLQDVVVDGSMFDQVEVEGTLPSGLRKLEVADSKCAELAPMDLITSSFHQLSHLQLIDLCCRKVEQLYFTRERLGCLPSLKDLAISRSASLTTVYMDPGCLPNLKVLTVMRCYKLLVLEGVENLVIEGLEELILEELPRLQCDLRYPRTSMRKANFQLEAIRVIQCPQLKIDLNILGASKYLFYVVLRGTCVTLAHELNRSIVGLLNAPMRTEDGIRDGDERSNACGNSKAYILHNPAAPPSSTSASPMPTSRTQKLMDFNCDLFQYLVELELDDMEQLRDLEGIHQAQYLYYLKLKNLPNFIRITGIWPTCILLVTLQDCPMLQEIPSFKHARGLRRLSCVGCLQLKAVEGSFDQMKELKSVDFVKCESMDVFPLKDVMDELGKRSGRAYDRGSWETDIRWRVHGSKFASVGELRRWLGDARLGSTLFEAAMQALIWEYLQDSIVLQTPGTPGALDALHDYFSSLVSPTREDLLYLRRLFFQPCPENKLPTSSFQACAETKTQKWASLQEWMLRRFPQIAEISE